MAWKPIKLIRDKVIPTPDGTIETVDTIHVKPVDKDEVGRMLRAKLLEETAEYLEDRNVEELADIIEVCLALAAHEHGIGATALLSIADSKRYERGGFANMLGIFVRVRAGHDE